MRFFRYNMKIVFGSRFIYFLTFAILLYITILLINLFNHYIPNEAEFYYILIIPAVAIILFPTSFGVQSDRDGHTLEVLFSVPDYRYKVWLFRIIITFILTFLILLALAALTHYLIADLNIFKMAGQLMFPILFCGTLAFMLSTWFKSGTGAAVVLVLLIIVFFIFQDYFEEKSWYLYLNPFQQPGSMSDIAWRKIVIQNRVYQSALSILFLLFGLFNLQKREGFLK